MSERYQLIAHRLATQDLRDTAAHHPTEVDAATAHRCIDAAEQTDHLDVLQVLHAHRNIPASLKHATTDTSTVSPGVAARQGTKRQARPRQP